MSLSSWRKIVRLVRRPLRFAPGQRPATELSASHGLRLEQLEDRTLLSTYQWLGTSSALWSDPGNWTGGPAGTFPSLAGDVAQFTGSITGSTTVTVNQAITVGEIDFNTASNITINSTGTNVLTLDNTPNPNAILNVAATNTGTQVLNTPVTVAAGTPLLASVSGGTLQLTSTADVIDATSAFTVNPGATLRASAAGAGSLVMGNLVDAGALGSAALNLAGGTLTLDPTASTAANGVASDYIAQTTNQLNGNDFLTTPAIAGTPTFQTAAVAAAPGLANTFAFGTNAPANLAGQSFGTNVPTTDFGVRWTGMLNVTTPGPTTFTSTSDDAMKVYVDGVLVVNNNASAGGHGPDAPVSGTVTLSAGLHDIRVDYTQGTGGDEALLTWTPAGGTAQPIPFSALYAPDPLDLGNAVNVTANSAIQLNGGNFTAVGLGALTLGADLTVTGQAGKRLNFSGATATVNPVTLNDTVDVGFVSSYATNPYTPGVVNIPNATFYKQGAGQLFLDNTSTTTPNVLLVLDIQGGRVVAVGSSTANSNSDPLGTGSVQFDGGTLSLDSRNGAVTFDNAVNVMTVGGTIEDQADAQTLALGSATTANTVTIASGLTLNVNTFGGTPTAVGNTAGATLQINEPISGGTLVKNNVPISTTANPGTLILSPVAANSFANLTVNGGTVTDTTAGGLSGAVAVNNGGQVTVNAAGTATNVTGFTVNPGGTVLIDDSAANVNNRLGSTTALNLAGGTFTLTGNATAATSEQLGAISVQSGFSTVNMNKGAGGTLTLSAASLAQTTAGAGVNFAAPSGGGVYGSTNLLNVTTALPSTNGIVPFATVTGTDFAAGGGNTIAAFVGYVTSLAAATATSNVKLTGNDVVPAAGLTVNSLIINGTNLSVTGSATLTSGAVLITGGTDSVNAPLNIGTAGALITNTGATANYNGPIGGSALAVAGGGTTVFNNADTYTGGTTLESGILSIGNPTGLGTGALTLINGTVQASIATTVSNAVNLTSAGGPNGTVTLGGSTPLTFSGAVNLTGDNTLTLANPAGTTFSGALSGTGSLTLVGGVANGTLALSGDNSAFTGALTLQGGNLVLGSNNALPGGATLSGGTVLASTAVTTSAALTVNGPVTFAGGNALTLGGAVTTTAGAALTVNNSTTITGAVTGPLELAGGLGTLTLDNSATVSGDTTVAGGTLSVGSAAPLGTGTLWLSGGTVQPTAAGLTFSNPVQLGGTPTLGGTVANAATFSGPVTLASATTLSVTNGTTITGVIGGGPTAGLTLAGGTLNLQAANTYTGTTTIGGGNLVLNGAGGALTATSGIVINQGGTLTLDNTGTNNTNRVNAAASVTFNGGTGVLLGNGSAPTVQAVGAITLNSGQSTITVNTSGPGAGFNPASLSRNPGATVNYTGNAVLPSTATSLLPFATANGSNFAVIDPVTGPAAFTAYTTSLPSGGGTGTENVKLTGGTTTVTQNTTIFSLVLANGANLTISPGVTLTLVSGGLLTVGGNSTISGGTLVLGTNATTDGVLSTDATTTSLTINSTIAGIGGLTLSGAGTVTLNAANTYTGTTWLNGGTLVLGNAAALTGGALSLTGGTLQTAVAGGVSLGNAVTLNNAAVTFSGSNPIVFTAAGSVTLGGLNNTVTVGNAAGTPLVVWNGTVTTLAGAVGNLIKSGPGTLVLSGANNYTGQTLVNQGIIQVQNTTNTAGTVPYTTPLGNPYAGAATTVAAGASVQILGTGLSIDKALVLNGGTLENLTGGNNTWTGNIVLAVPSTIAVDPATTLTITTATVNALPSGGISGSGNLTKTGAGTLVLNAADTYTGQTIINGGNVNVQNGLALGLPTGQGGDVVTVNAGATLQVQGGITVAGKNVTLNGTGFGNTAGQSGVLPQGALVNLTGTNTWSGNITLTGTAALTGGAVPLLAGSNTASSIGSASGTALFVSGVVSGTDLMKVGAGTLTLLNTDTYTGATVVLGGNLTLANNNTAAVGATTVAGSAVNGVTSTVNGVTYTNFAAGSLTVNGLGTLGTSAVTIDQGGQLTLDNTAINQQRFTNATAPNLTFNTGSFTYLANNSAGTSSAETVGTVTLNSGQSVINAGYAAAPVTGAGGSTFTVNTLVRNLGATVNFVGGTGNASPLGVATNGVLNQLLVNNGLTATNGTAGTFSANGYQYFGNGASGVGNIIPFAEVNGGVASDFASYSTTGVTAFANYIVQTFSAATGTLTVTTASDIIKVVDAFTAAVTVTVPSNTTFGALLVSMPTTAAGTLLFTWASGSTVTIASGAYVSTGNNTANNITFGVSGAQWVLPAAAAPFTGETIVFADKGTTSNRFDATIVGSGSLVVGGAGAFAFDQQAAGSNYSGGTTINASSSVFLITATANFGTGPVTINGGAFAPTSPVIS